VPADALEVCGGRATEVTVERLVDRSLVWLDEATTPPRLRMYDTVRAYIQRELPPEDAQELLGRKRRWLVERLQAVAGGPDREIRDAVSHLVPDLREVMVPDPAGTDEDRAEAVDAAAGTAPWFEAAGLWDEGIRRLELAIDHAPADPRRRNAQAVLAHLQGLVGNSEIAFALAREVLGDASSPDLARSLSCIVLSTPGTPVVDGEDLLVEAIRLAGSEDSSLALAARVRLALRKIAAGDADGAVADLTEIARVAGRDGRTMHHAQALVNLGGALIRTGRVDEAEATLREGRERALEARLPKLAAGCLTNLGMIALFRGDPTSALALAEERLAISLQMGDLPGAASARMVIGNAAGLLGDRPRAKDEMRQTFDLFRKVGVVEGCATALFNLALLAAADQDVAEAGRTTAELAGLARTSPNPSLHALALAAAAGIAAQDGLLDGAVLLGAAAAHGPATTPLDPADLAWLAACEAALVERTSAEDVADGRARGAALALDEALALAARVADDLAGR
jgi:tetratricopeptide (TPR) repeat protein